MKKIKIFKMKNIVEQYFKEGTYKNFLLHEFLFVVNIFLFIIFISEILVSSIYEYNHILHYFHNIELFFGIIFSFEFILRMYFVYLPNKIYFKPYLILNLVVILTLIVPQIFGNLAFLRLIRSFKIIKIFILNKEQKKDLKEHPNFMNTKDVLLRIIKKNAKKVKK